MSEHAGSIADVAPRGSAVERWCTSSALLLAGVTAAVAAVLIGRAEDGTDGWRAVIVLWGAAPSAVAWSVTHHPRLIAARVPVLWLALVPAVLASLFSYLLLAPSLVLMLIAALRATQGGLPDRREQALRATAGGALFAAGWGAGLRALFWAMDERCRETATSVSCSSDVVTLPEAAVAIALLAAGAAAAVVLARER